jgi:hypothetical protein
LAALLAGAAAFLLPLVFLAVVLAVALVADLAGAAFLADDFLAAEELGSLASAVGALKTKNNEKSIPSADLSICDSPKRTMKYGLQCSKSRKMCKRIR